jgi:hypothetical protein
VQLAQQSGDQGTKLDTAIVSALLDAKSGKTDAALKALAAAEKDARAGGMVQIEHDARLALGETLIASGHKNDGRATSRRPAQETKAHRFALTAQKALAASQGRRLPPAARGSALIDDGRYTPSNDT